MWRTGERHQIPSHFNSTRQGQNRPERIRVMFGRMRITPIVEVEPDTELEKAVAAMLRATEQAEIIRWIEFPASLLLFLLTPGDAESGAIYVLDRMQGIWCAVDFDDQQYGGYSASHFEQLLRQCNFLDLMECPGLWRPDLSWSVEPGTRPAAHV
jgi:hypothetical protein